jgi:phage/plasmid-like protein (TIGR03299 family)
MSHNVQTMFYAGVTPWHGLGTKVEKNLTAAEAIVAAGLNWEVDKVPVFSHSLDKKLISVPGKFAVRRLDNSQPLGIVGARYTPLQNKNAFSFMDAVVQVKEAIYHTAGALGLGERVWLLAQLPKDLVVKGVDKVEKFLLLTSTHNGTTQVTIKMTPIRVVCQNTLNASLRDGESQANLRHTKTLGLKLTKVREQIGLVNKWFDKLGETYNQLASKQCGLKAFNNYVRTIGLVPEEPTEEFGQKSKTLQIMEDLSTRFEKGLGNDQLQIKGTWWTAYNAVTEHVDHSPLFGRAKNLNDRARSLLFGAGSFVKERAFTRAVELARK